MNGMVDDAKGEREEEKSVCCLASFPPQACLALSEVVTIERH
jgi:hypothetical protein